MSACVVGLILNANIEVLDKLILINLGDCADDDGRSVMPSASWLSRRCGIDDQKLSERLWKLGRFGLIQIEEEWIEEFHGERWFKINIVKIEALQIARSNIDGR